MKKLRTNLMLGGVMLVLLMMLASCGNGDNALEEIINGGGSGGSSTVTEITIDLTALDAKYLNDEKTQLELKVGDEVTLSFTIKPDELADTDVTLTSDDPTVVSIDGKKVKALKMGTTTITAKAGEKSATCEVTVTAGLSTPLTLEVTSVVGGTTISVSGAPASMQFSLDGGTTKKALSTVSGNISGLSVGDKVTFYGTATSYNGTQIISNCDVKVYGNIMSLLGEEFADNKMLTANNTFQFLFGSNHNLKDASGLLLPATTLTTGCYQAMFYNCTNLTTAPKELPVTNLTSAGYCYCQMFYGCTKLTATPKLPATTLADYCYQQMFDGCTSLTTAYVKAAYTNANNECTNMFNACLAAGTKTLHTTTASKTSWDGVMPTAWAGWTAVDDWTD